MMGVKREQETHEEWTPGYQGKPSTSSHRTTQVSRPRVGIPYVCQCVWYSSASSNRPSRFSGKSVSSSSPSRVSSSSTSSSTSTEISTSSSPSSSSRSDSFGIADPIGCDNEGFLCSSPANGFTDFLSKAGAAGLGVAPELVIATDFFWPVLGAAALGFL